MEQIVQSFGKLDELRLQRDTEETIQRTATQQSSFTAHCDLSPVPAAARHLDLTTIWVWNSPDKLKCV